MTAADDGAPSHPPAIGPEQVAHVARLARLELNEEELARFTKQLASVLDYAAAIAQLDVGELEPMSRPLPLHNVLRADEPTPGVDRDEVLAEAPAAEDRRFRVPRILSEEG
ncbi:MAG: Asp-tRNA(Asn)/Glu-tRNA(Gln) amidotransferase subunit GatC [Acidimicrobiales bacterium]